MFFTKFKKNVGGLKEEETPQGTKLIKPFILGIPIAVFLSVMQKTEGDVWNDKHCFIPTKSALAFKGSNQDLGEALKTEIWCVAMKPLLMHIMLPKKTRTMYRLPKRA